MWNPLFAIAAAHQRPYWYQPIPLGAPAGAMGQVQLAARYPQAQAQQFGPSFGFTTVSRLNDWWAVPTIRSSMDGGASTWTFHVRILEVSPNGDWVRIFLPSQEDVPVGMANKQYWVPTMPDAFEGC